ncbi:siderophore-iron reductase FhuF [Vreelandella zhaodongensis]|uniref:Siderophore-iron reductase FhuF n=1 Tax=Vreelandella zhaodongensis TaxID=1176240 RepID=A0ABX2SS02_VREZH|nr:siderophore-iron reductase FhuF [Halomonas zhaodongensis]NYS44309.1 siderophore-iron reductase FhuF [Halomonas zhaodongensis]
MPPALTTLYLGPLEGLLPPVLGVPPDGPYTLPAWKLLSPSYLTPLLERFTLQYGRGDRRAVASLWSKWHFSSVISAALAANLLLERDLPLGLDDLHLELTPEGQTRRLWLHHAGKPLASQDAFTRFSTLIEGHLTPLITTLAQLSGASPKVFWSNAGNYFEHFAEALQAHPLAEADVAEPARELMANRHLPDGRRNPLFQPVRYLQGTHGTKTERRRRLCCIRYLMPELGYCGNCPLNQGKCRH